MRDLQCRQSLQTECTLQTVLQYSRYLCRHPTTKFAAPHAFLVAFTALDANAHLRKCSANERARDGSRDRADAGPWPRVLPAHSIIKSIKDPTVMAYE